MSIIGDGLGRSAAVKTRETSEGRRSENYDNSSQPANLETVGPGIINYPTSLFVTPAEFEEASM